MKPRLFVGSAGESLEVAYAVQENLERDADVTVWTQGVFDLNQITLRELIQQAHRSDFATFVFGAEDVATIRDSMQRVARDNVVFEVGLFIGVLGQDRCSILMPRLPDGQELHLPSDLAGVTPGTYEPHRHDDNMTAALGPSCHQLRKLMKRLGVLGETPPEINPPSRSPEQIWKQALSTIEDMTADYAAYYHTVEAVDAYNWVIRFKRSHTLQKESCEKPNRRAKLESALAGALGCPVRITFEIATE